MTWFAPNILLFIFALPLLVLFFLWVLRRKRKLLERFADWHVLQRLMKSSSIERQIIKFTLIIFSAALIIVTLGRPQWGSVDKEIVRKGLDIIVGIDVSLSMKATDIKPNRLERAKDQLGTLIDRIEQSRGDRIGILAFAGDAFMACPLTVDYDLARRYLTAVDTNRLTRGTMIGRAIEVSNEAFDRAGSDGDKLLILLTDGEDQGSQPMQMAAKAADNNIRIFAIGIGSEEGVPLEINGKYKRDENDQIVQSRLDFSMLREVTRATGGDAIKSLESGYLELDRIIAAINDMKRTQLNTQVFALREDRFQWFLFPAILLLVVEMLLSDRRKISAEWKGRFQ